MGYRLANIEGRAALVAGEDYYDLEGVSEGSMSSDPMAALASLSALSKISAGLADLTPSGKLADVNLGAPVPRPPSVFAIGLNYRNHAEESKMPIPDVPMLFTKYSSCIVGPDADINMRSDFTDFEAELVVAIGQGGRDISVADGWKHVAGLCVGQDFSDRAVQFCSSPPQFSLAKSMDTFGPIGPLLVSADELEDPNSLAIECVINGEVRQQDNTNDLIFNVPTLVSYLSQLVTLQTGDLIFTGTPGGVGVIEGRFLQDGDVVTTTVEGIGSIVNTCVRGGDHPNASFVPGFIQSKLDRLNDK
ncbi:MAG: 2,4-diketo-3-deoxy-L-fuconate hydrolase [Halioglobus sp.]|jgi:2,4-diketo-3-deoxy-L-fuconate hydrolase